MKSKRFCFVFIYGFVCLLLLETACRAFWAVKHGVPFFDGGAVIEVFYPELRVVREAPGSDGSWDILFLGGSVLTEDYGDLPGQIAERLAERSGKEVRVFNLSQKAHTSKDSLVKYKHLAGHSFDLVVFYHGINEVRANNVPDEKYKKDYSHFSWYEKINALERHGEISLLVFPFTLDFLRIEVARKIKPKTYVPAARPPKEWLRYGGSIKTEQAFKENSARIADLARARGEKLLFMTYAFFVPENYSEEKFLKGISDYSARFPRKESRVCPVGIWGEPAHVVKGIEAHNRVLRSLAGAREDVLFLDQEKLFPKEGTYFMDVCHLSVEGNALFVKHTLDFLAGREVLK